MLTSERVSQRELEQLFRAHLYLAPVLPPAQHSPDHHSQQTLAQTTETDLNDLNSTKSKSRTKSKRRSSRVSGNNTIRASSVPPDTIEYWSKEPYVGKSNKWLKYGQKQIKSVTKEYYKCYEVNCGARRFVERHVLAGEVRYRTLLSGKHNHELPDSVKYEGIINSSDELRRIVHDLFPIQHSTNPETPKRKTKAQKKVEIKCSLEVNTSNDGFKWKKYGSKEFKGGSEPRGYFRCTVEACPARKTHESRGSYILLIYTSDHYHPSPNPEQPGLVDGTSSNAKSLKLPCRTPQTPQIDLAHLSDPPAFPIFSTDLLASQLRLSGVLSPHARPPSDDSELYSATDKGRQQSAEHQTNIIADSADFPLPLPQLNRPQSSIGEEEGANDVLHPPKQGRRPTKRRRTE